MRQKADGNKIFSMEKQVGSYRYQDNLGEQNVQPTQSVSLAVIQKIGYNRQQRIVQCEKQTSMTI